MGHPVTTNPIIIMLINMTVVFIVLISLSYLIRLIHLVDPTAKKEEVKAEAPAVAPAPVVQNAPVIDDRIPEEVVAVIFAAIAGYGYSTGQVHAIHPVYHKVWEHSGRYHQPM